MLARCVMRIFLVGSASDGLRTWKVVSETPTPPCVNWFFIWVASTWSCRDPTKESQFWVGGCII